MLHFELRTVRITPKNFSASDSLMHIEEVVGPQENDIYTEALNTLGTIAMNEQMQAVQGNNLLYFNLDNRETLVNFRYLPLWLSRAV